MAGEPPRYGGRQRQHQQTDDQRQVQIPIGVTHQKTSGQHHADVPGRSVPWNRTGADGGDLLVPGKNDLERILRLVQTWQRGQRRKKIPLATVG